MGKLDDVSLEELHDALETVTGAKPTQRLMLAILYKQGPSVPMLAEWFDMRERTIYDWFDRIEARPLDEAVHDDPRPGRPPKLDAGQRDAFEAALKRPPSERGLDAETWTPPVARTFLREQFDVEYTRRHVRRLLAECDGAHVGE